MAVGLLLLIGVVLAVALLAIAVIVVLVAGDNKRYPHVRYRLRALLILLVIGPPILAWWILPAAATLYDAFRQAIEPDSDKAATVVEP